MFNKLKCKLVLFLFLVSVLSGCAGTGTKNYGAISYDAPSDQAVLFVGRKNRFIASGALPKILLDGREVAKLGIGEMQRVNISTGSHKIQTKIGNILQIGIGSDSASFVAEKGKKYFYIIDFDQGFFSSKWKLTETTENGFQGALD